MRPGAHRPAEDRERPAAATREASDARGEETRRALVAAGMKLFGELGYHAASSRKLAEEAGVNQALIGYHFGGKRGLYLAVFEHVAAAMGAHLEPVATGIEARLGPPEEVPDDAGREQLMAGLLALIDRFVELFSAPETAAWATLIVREQQRPSEAFDLLWQRVMSPALELLSRFVGALRGEPADTEEVRLLALTLAGQVLFFRVARASALRALGWQEVGPAQVEAIKQRIHHNVRTLLSAETRR